MLSAMRRTWKRASEAVRGSADSPASPTPTHDPSQLSAANAGIARFAGSDLGLYNRIDRGSPREVCRDQASRINHGKMVLFTRRLDVPPQDQGMQFKLDEIDPEGRVHVSAEGEMTSADVENVNPLENVVGQRWSSNRVLMDLSRVSYIDSMAIGWLINCHKKFKEAGGCMVLHSIPPHVRQIFDLLKISMLFPLAENKHAACHAANGDEA